MAIFIAIFMFFIILIISSNQQNAQNKNINDLIEQVKFIFNGFIQKKIFCQERKDYEYLSQWLKYDPNVRIKPEFDRFIYSNTMESELGNQAS